jgi:hypothetical protein
LHEHKTLHTIETKPIAHARLDSHTEAEIKSWFDDYHATLKKYKITKAKNVINFNESGARIGCAGKESIVVPKEVKEIYTASSENRKSITICEAIRADGSEPPPPFIIVPGQKIMDNWSSFPTWDINSTLLTLSTVSDRVH